MRNQKKNRSTGVTRDHQTLIHILTICLCQVCVCVCVCMVLCVWSHLFPSCSSVYRGEGLGASIKASHTHSNGTASKNIYGSGLCEDGGERLSLSLCVSVSLSDVQLRVSDGGVPLTC